MSWTARVSMIWMLAILASAGILLAQEAAVMQPAARERPTGPVDRKQCFECHPQVRAHAVPHGPILVEGCATCHRVQSAEEHTFTVPEQICLSCHAGDHSSADGQTISFDCRPCHAIVAWDEASPEILELLVEK